MDYNKAKKVAKYVHEKERFDGYMERLKGLKGYEDQAQVIMYSKRDREQVYMLLEADIIIRVLKEEMERANRAIRNLEG